VQRFPRGDLYGETEQGQGCEGGEDGDPGPAQHPAARAADPHVAFRARPDQGFLTEGQGDQPLLERVLPRFGLVLLQFQPGPDLRVGFSRTLLGSEADDPVQDGAEGRTGDGPRCAEDAPGEQRRDRCYCPARQGERVDLLFLFGSQVFLRLAVVLVCPPVPG
jgi:hypothetical protein